MSVRKYAIAGLIALTAMSSTASAEYPERPVKLVIPYSPGGGIDLMLRALAEGLSAKFNQPFVVENRGGAGGAIGVAHVANSPADGYTLLFVPALAYSMLPLTQDVTYSDKSFTPICQTFENQMALVVRKESPFKNVRDLVETARANPSSVSFGSSPAGNITHLAAVALADTTNVKFNNIPFKGDGEIMGPLIGGHIDFAALTLASAAAAGGNVRIIGIFADQRNSSLPDIPTVKEQGYDVAPTSFGGLFAPVGVPADMLKTIETGCKFATEQPGYVKIAATFHQGNNFYADSATFKRKLDADVVAKKTLLTRLGLAK